MFKYQYTYFIIWKKEKKGRKLKEQKKFDILITVIKLLDATFTFFITLNILIILNSILLLEYRGPCLMCAGCPCPPLQYFKMLPFYKIRLVGGIIAISLAIPIFIIIRLLLVYKLKTPNFNLIKKNYGGSEDLFKFYREFQAGKRLKFKKKVVI